MKKIQFIAVGFLLGSMLLSCSEETLQNEEPVTGETICCDLRVSIAPMQESNAPTTRAAVDKSPGIDITYGGASGTRVSTDRMAEERKVKSLYMIQFAGTSDSSPVATKSGNLISSYDETVGGGIISNVVLANTGSVGLVYLVANADVSAFSGTLADFKMQRFVMPTGNTLDTIPPATGLPMVGAEVVQPGTGISYAITLSPLLARVTLNIHFPGTLTGKYSLSYNGPSTYNLGGWEQYPGDTRMDGSVANLALGSKSALYLNLLNGSATCTFYVPGNLAGRNLDLTDPKLRCPLTAPEGASSLRLVDEQKIIAYTLSMGDGSLTDFNVRAGRSYTYSVVIKKEDLDDFRCGLSGYEKLDEYNGVQETANCYLVTLSGNDRVCSFDCTVQGNGLLVESYNYSRNISPKMDMAPVRAEVLWETADVRLPVVCPRMFIVGKRLIFRMGPGELGNAVIGTYDYMTPLGENDVVLWSWHIWRSGEDPRHYGRKVDLSSTGVPVEVRKYEIMGFNLGATMSQSGEAKHAGLFYTWGRKDPFPGPDAVGSTTLTKVVGTHVPKSASQSINSVGVLDLIRHYSFKTPWLYFPYSTYSDNEMPSCWGGKMYNYQSGINGADVYFNYKTFLDPCPPGWQVPPAYWVSHISVSSWNATEKALMFSNGIFLPCTGYSGFETISAVPVDQYNTEIKTDCGVYYTSNGDYNTEQCGLGGASVFASGTVNNPMLFYANLQNTIGTRYNKASVRCVRFIEN